MAATRDQIRSGILSGEKSKPLTREVSFFGQIVELRQPDLNTILDMRSGEDKDRKTMMIDMIIAYVFVPGTQDHVFEEADKDTLLSLPFGSDYTRINQAIKELTDVDVLQAQAEKNSD